MKYLGEQFLHKNDSELSESQPVEYAQMQRERKEDEILTKPQEKIADWLKIVAKTHLAHSDDPQVLDRIRSYYHKKYVIKPEHIPESYFDLQKRIAREQGHGEIEITDELREQAVEVIIADQRSTLNNWIDYFTSPDSASYPMWAKYWTFTGMLKLGIYDKKKHAFNPRIINSKDIDNTVALFADLNREALAYVVDALVKKYGEEYFPLQEKILSNQVELVEAEEKLKETQIELKKTENQEKANQISQLIDAKKQDYKKFNQSLPKIINLILPDGEKVSVKRQNLDKMQANVKSGLAPVIERQKKQVEVWQKILEELRKPQIELNELLRAKNLPLEFMDSLEKEDFGKLYTYAIEKVTPASIDQLTITKGKWVKFSKGTDPTIFIPEDFNRPLVESLQGHGTGWCTAGESTARIQLQGGDFYVYYSDDKHGNPIIPRIAIRMKGENKIAEVRGIAEQQNLDPFVANTDILDKKLNEFGVEGKDYQKKVVDMKRLTVFEKKINKKEKFTKDELKEELTFLYEINEKIQGFGYQNDPRIKEIRDGRDSKVDVPIVFGCDPEQIAWNQKEVNQKTKVYIGPLFTDIFVKLGHLEHIYTSFPEGKIRKHKIEIDYTKDKIEQEFEEKNIYVSDYAKKLLKSNDFKESQQKIAKLGIKDIDLVQLSVGNLGFRNAPKIEEIRWRAEKFGLYPCPVGVGPVLRLKYSGKECINIVANRIGYLDAPRDVFNLSSNDGRLELNAHSESPIDRLFSDNYCVFSLCELDY
jgi:hypothetical protein